MSAAADTSALERPAANLARSAAIFWAKVDRSGECWLWQGGLDKDGYGKFQVTLSRAGLPPRAHTPQRHVRAHHFAYELAHGAPVFGALLMHSCDNPRCVRPEHLRIGTPAENYADSARKGRNTRGERNARAKLTAESVRAIRAGLAAGARLVDLARQHGVTATTILGIARGRIWKHVAANDGSDGGAP